MIHIYKTGMALSLKLKVLKLKGLISCSDIANFIIGKISGKQFREVFLSITNFRIIHVVPLVSDYRRYVAAWGV